MLSVTFHIETSGLFRVHVRVDRDKLREQISLSLSVMLISKVITFLDECMSNKLDLSATWDLPDQSYN